MYRAVFDMMRGVDGSFTPADMFEFGTSEAEIEDIGAMARSIPRIHPHPIHLAHSGEELLKIPPSLRTSRSWGPPADLQQLWLALNARYQAHQLRTGLLSWSRWFGTLSEEGLTVGLQKKIEKTAVKRYESVGLYMCIVLPLGCWVNVPWCRVRSMQRVWDEVHCCYISICIYDGSQLGDAGRMECKMRQGALVTLDLCGFYHLCQHRCEAVEKNIWSYTWERTRSIDPDVEREWLFAR